MPFEKFSIGLTGGIGSGKSFVADLFAAHGASVIDTDQIAHRLNAGDALPLAEVRATLDAFRRDLIGVKHDAEDVEDESEG